MKDILKVVFASFLTGILLSTIYIRVLTVAHEDCVIEEYRLREEVATFKQNELIVMHYKNKRDRMFKVGGLAYDQASFEFDIACESFRKSGCLVTQAKARMRKADNWLRIVTFGFGGRDNSDL